MQKTHQGSCHCGAVRFECDVDLATAETSRCNCSICRKQRFWKTLVPEGAFRLKEGQDSLTEYMFGGRHIHHFFCKTCGTKPFGRVYLDLTMGGQALKGEFYAINVAALDDASDAELAAAQLVYQNGRENDWMSAPAITQHL